MRYTLLDGFRGYFLLMMMNTHLASALLLKTTYPAHIKFGLVEDAARGFVFLSGLVIALVFGKVMLNRSEVEMKRACWKRGALVFYYHAATLFIVSCLALIPSPGRDHIIQFAGFGENIWQDFILSFLTLSGPKYVAILPMYVVFIAFTPFLLILMKREQLVLVVVGSVAVWTVS